MRLSTRLQAVILSGVAVIVAIAFVVLWLIPSIVITGRTGLAIENETSGPVGFDITSPFSSGHLDVAANGVGTFDVASGTNVPNSFNVTITAPPRTILFHGTLDPGVDCWAYLKWNGTALEAQSYKVCT